MVVGFFFKNLHCLARLIALIFLITTATLQIPLASNKLSLHDSSFHGTSVVRLQPAKAATNSTNHGCSAATLAMTLSGAIPLRMPGSDAGSYCLCSVDPGLLLLEAFEPIGRQRRRQEAEGFAEERLLNSSWLRQVWMASRRCLQDGPGPQQQPAQRSPAVPDVLKRRRSCMWLQAAEN